jgi:hypothetical protein
VKKKRFIVLVIGIALILSIPVVMTNFSNELNWTIHDFILAFFFLFSYTILIEYTSRKILNVKIRYFLITLIVMSLLLIWAELAVNLF